MNEKLLQALALVGVPIVTGCLGHICVKRYFLASILSAVVCVILFPVFSYIEMGYFDPLLVFGLIPIFLICFPISLVIGLPFWAVRKNRNYTKKK